VFNIEVIIKGKPEEIATFVLELQKWQKDFEFLSDNIAKRDIDVYVDGERVLAG